LRRIALKEKRRVGKCIQVMVSKKYVLDLVQRYDVKTGPALSDFL
jgi:hypothetical protein